MISCEIDVAGPEVATCSHGSPYLPSAISEEMFSLELSNGHLSGFTSNPISVAVDNALSPSHTLVQMQCQDHKGLIYDIMRTLKDYNIQVPHFNSEKLLKIYYKYFTTFYFHMLNLSMG